jgi:hypothetical protein
MAYDHQEALDWFDDAISADQDNRDQFDRNQDMLHGNQWSEKDRVTRGEGALVVNKLDTPVILITNQIAQALPGPEVSRRDGPDDEQTAIVYEGILRDIQYCSMADERYLRQADYVAGGNIGWLRLYVDYVSHASFDQELKIGDLADPMMVVADPQAREPDKSDMQRLILRQPMRFAEYKRRFGEDPTEAHRGFAGTPSQVGSWFDLPEKMIWVAEDWLVEYETKRLVRVGGRDYFSDDRDLPLIIALSQQGVENERKENVPVVKQRLVDGTRVLEKKEWPGTTIPFFPVIMEERAVRGRLQRKSAITDALTSQKLRNYVSSQQAIDFRNAPTSKFMVGSSAIAGHEHQYRDVSNPDQTVLLFNEYDEQGRQLTPPIYQRYETNMQNYIMTLQQIDGDIQEATRTPPAALGLAQSAMESGKKVQLLQQQSGLANSHAGRSLKKAVQALYRSAIEAIPAVYNKAQAIRIVGPDDKKSTVWINQHLLDDRERRADPRTGMVKLHQLGLGRYDVVANVGPSYQTQQAETAEKVIQLTNTIPQIALQGPDQVLKLMELGPQGEELIKRVTPDQYKEQQGPMDPQALNQQLQQMQQRVQLLTDQLNKTSHIIETDQIKQQGEMERAKLQSWTTLEAKRIDVEGKVAVEQLQSRLLSLENELGFIREDRLQRQTAAHEAALAQQSHVHRLTEKQQGHDHAAEAANNGSVGIE